MTTPLVPPNAMEAEAAILAAIILQPSLFDEVSAIVKPEHFYSQANRNIFESCGDLVAKGQPIDIVMVKSRLSARGQLAGSGGPVYLAEILGNVPHVSNVAQYAKVVADKARLRAVIEACSRIAVDAYAVEDTQAFIGSAVDEMTRIADSGSAGDGVITLKDSTIQTVKDMDAELKARAAGKTTIIKTGLKDLDYALSGLLKGQFIVLAARPSCGKTSLLLQMATNIASQQMTPVVGVHIISGETVHTRLAARVMGNECSVPANSILQANINTEEYRRLVAGASRIARLPITIDDKSSPSIQSIRSSIRKARSTLLKRDESGKIAQDLGIVFVDYLQLCKSGIQQGRNGNREQEVGEVARALHALAKDFSIPVVALAQLSRGCESRDNKRPMMSDIRESGWIENEADAIIGMYRDGYYNKTSEEPNVVELIILKSKEGARGTVKVRFVPEYMRFEDM